MRGDEQRRRLMAVTAASIQLLTLRIYDCRKLGRTDDEQRRSPALKVLFCLHLARHIADRGATK